MINRVSPQDQAAFSSRNERAKLSCTDKVLLTIVHLVFGSILAIVWWVYDAEILGNRMSYHVLRVSTAIWVLSLVQLAIGRFIPTV